MQTHRRRPRSWRVLSIQRAIMALTLAAYPYWRSQMGLRREFDDTRAFEDALKLLLGIGLLEAQGASVRPTEVVAHLEKLRLP